MKKELKIQYISSGQKPEEHLKNIQKCLEAGVKWIQLRMKGFKQNEIITTAIKTKSLCQKYKAIFILNDEVQVAKEIGADGVHIGKNDKPIEETRRILGNNKIIGATANTFEDVLEINDSSADYIGLGPYKFTSTKKKLSPILGLEGYQNILKKNRFNDLKLPIVAVGGIVEEDISKLLELGFNGVAISGYFNREKNLKEKLSQWKN